MVKLGLVLSMAVVLVACSEPDPSTPKVKKWQPASFAGGAVTFMMPNYAETKTTEFGSGEERITEEIAACTYYEMDVGQIRFLASVMSGPSLAKEMGPDAMVRGTWSKLMIVEMIAAEPGHKNLDEGKWAFTEEGGYWLHASAPPNPPKRTVSVMLWFRVAPFGERALVQKFICMKGQYEDPVARPKIDKMREKYFSSFTAK